MRIFFDTEFIIHKDTCTLLALGAVRDDGLTFYAENGDCDITKADDWVQRNVLPHLTGPVYGQALLGVKFREFLGPTPELWAYFCTQDHMLILDLLGGWLPTPEPARVCHDLATLLLLKNMTEEQMPKIDGPAHNALVDARWVRAAYWAMDP